MSKPIRVLAKAAAVVIIFLGPVYAEAAIRRLWRTPLNYEPADSSQPGAWTVEGYEEPDFLWAGKKWVVTIRTQAAPTAKCVVSVPGGDAQVPVPEQSEGGRAKALRLYYNHDTTNVPLEFMPSSPPTKLILHCDNESATWLLRQR